MTTEAGPDRAARPKVELGWLLVGRWDPGHRAAAADAAGRVKGLLAHALPQFDWRLSVVDRPDAAEAGEVEPVLLLDDAEVERDRHGWDFVFVLTERRLVSYTRPAVAAPARIFSTAILSTAPLADSGESNALPRDRLVALAMHLFGRLCDLAPRDGSGFMRDFASVTELSAMDGFEPDELEHLREHLEDVADLRVEEMQGQAPHPAAFYLRALRENRRALPRAILRMRPWSFPARLTRLTTAAGSALVILMMTAESWEVAANLGIGTVALLAVVAIAATSAYLLKAQRLLARSGGGALGEQRVVSNVSTVLAVGIGMSVSYVALFAITFAAASLLFGGALLEAWVGAGGAQATPLRAHMAAFTAAISLAIGALGASFEPRGYFRHVTHIDDEL